MGSAGVMSAVLKSVGIGNLVACDSVSIVGKGVDLVEKQRI